MADEAGKATIKFGGDNTQLAHVLQDSLRLVRQYAQQSHQALSQTVQGEAGGGKQGSNIGVKEGVKLGVGFAIGGAVVGSVKRMTEGLAEMIAKEEVARRVVKGWTLDLAKSSEANDTFSSRFAKLAKQFDSIKARIADALLPVLDRLSKILWNNKKYFDMAGNAVVMLIELFDMWVGQLEAKVGPVADLVGNFTARQFERLRVFGINALAALKVAFTNWRDVCQVAIDGLSLGLLTLIEDIKAWFNNEGPGAIGAWATNFANNFKWLKDRVKHEAEGMIGYLKMVSAYWRGDMAEAMNWYDKVEVHDKSVPPLPGIVLPQDMRQRARTPQEEALGQRVAAGADKLGKAFGEAKEEVEHFFENWQPGKAWQDKRESQQHQQTQVWEDLLGVSKRIQAAASTQRPEDKITKAVEAAAEKQAKAAVEAAGMVVDGIGEKIGAPNVAGFR